MVPYAFGHQCRAIAGLTLSQWFLPTFRPLCSHQFVLLVKINYLAYFLIALIAKK
jgi:hypothetical protein